MYMKLGLTPSECCVPISCRYVLAYIESFGGLKRGEKIWQMGFGSGFKCNSAVWKANRRIKDQHDAWAGFDVDEMRAHLASLPNHKKAAQAQ